MDLRHTQWGLVPWDPESTSFGPFRNSTPFIFRQSPLIRPSYSKVKYFFSSVILLTPSYSPYLRHEHLFCLCSPSCPDMAQPYLCLHSIRTQPSTRESCITHPPVRFFSLSSTCCVPHLVIPHLFFPTPIYFSPFCCLQHVILCTTTFFIP